MSSRGLTVWCLVIAVTRKHCPWLSWMVPEGSLFVASLSGMMGLVYGLVKMLSQLSFCAIELVCSCGREATSADPLSKVCTPQGLAMLCRRDCVIDAVVP